ncbi:ionotropic glutamate receptor [Holotrichia oblita]|uniref:Ionotropic glutamate receptor n=1 Tax=Holotrichia oblita TaxID=644536 RepID=A0ACB9SSR5_HOLOL|nr:ionotropic glutamate receptor [Holotrichia oblita]
MKQFVMLLCFAAACIGNTDIPVDIGILYSDEDPIADIAIRHMEVRFKLFTNYSINTHVVNVKDMGSCTVENIVCDIIEKGIYGIIGPPSEPTNLIVQSVSEKLELPQLQTFWNPAMNDADNRTQILNLYPDANMLGKAWATLIKEMRWRSYVLLYEDDESLLQAQEILKFRREAADDFPIMIRKLLPDSDQSKQIHVILVCRSDRILDILKQAETINMFEDYRSYVLMSLDAHTIDISGLKNNSANITTLRMISTNKNSVRNVIRDWEFMEEQFQRPTKIDPETIKRPLTSGILSDLLTGTIEFDGFGRRKNFKLQILDFYNGRYRHTGDWSSEDPDHIKPLATPSNDTVYITDMNLQKGIIVRVAAKEGEPYVMSTYNNDTGQIEFEGYAVDLIDEISKLLKFSYEFYLVPDKKYGNYDPKIKNWNGLIREIIDRRAHLAICDLTITHERGRAVDFSMPFMTLGISILYSKATRKMPGLFAFTDPLSQDIWLCMATAYLIMSIIIYITARLTPSEWENPHPCDNNPRELENIWTFKNSFWLTLGSIMAQGCDILPKGLSTRMITSMWWFFSLIITASYTANLAAFLTNERMGPTIESYEDLAKQSLIKYGCVEGGATATFFRDSNVSTFQKMWRTMASTEPRVFQASNKDGVKKVKTSKRMYAFLMESSQIEYERERDCELTQVGSWLDTKGYGIAMPIILKSMHAECNEKYIDIMR